MTKAQYLAKRKELLAKSQQLIDEGKLTENEGVVADIQALDASYENIRTARANLEAISGKSVGSEAPLSLADTTAMELSGEVGRASLTATAEYREAWLLNLQGKEVPNRLQNAVSGAAAIPTVTMNKIVTRMELAPLYDAVDVTYIPGTVVYPVEDAVADAAWVEMGAAATDSDDTLTSITLSAYKLIKTLEIDADVQSMAIDDFEVWLVGRLSNKIVRAVCKGIVNGTGVNQATGLLKNGEITLVGTFTKAAMTFKDLMAIIAKVPTQYLDAAKFVMPRALFYSDILGMETADGSKVVVADAQSPAKFNILGYPVILEDNMTVDTLVFGDLMSYKFNWSQQPTVKSDESVGFRKGSTVYRAMGLADGKLADKNGICKYTRSAS